MVKRRKISSGAPEKIEPQAITANDSKGTACGRNYDHSRQNAIKHGILSKVQVLPGERQDEFDQLRDALREEHLPVSPTENLLVDEICSSFWRLRRVQRVEFSICQRAIANSIGPDGSAAAAALAHLGISLRQDEVDFEGVLKPPGQAAAQGISEFEERLEKIDAGLKELSSVPSGKRAAADLFKKVQGDLWPELEQFESAGQTDPNGEGGSWYRTESVDDLDHYLEAGAATKRYGLHDDSDMLIENLEHVLKNRLRPYVARKITELEHREEIRDYVISSGFDPEELTKTARYETTLQRQIARSLAMLIRLKQMRQNEDQRALSANYSSALPG